MGQYTKEMQQRDLEAEEKQQYKQALDHQIAENTILKERHKRELEKYKRKDETWKDIYNGSVAHLNLKEKRLKEVTKQRDDAMKLLQEAAIKQREANEILGEWYRVNSGFFTMHLRERTGRFLGLIKPPKSK